MSVRSSVVLKIFVEDNEKWVGRSGQWLVRGCSSHRWVGGGSKLNHPTNKQRCAPPPKIHPDWCSVIKWEVCSHHCWIGGTGQQSFNTPLNASCWLLRFSLKRSGRHLDWTVDSRMRLNKDVWGHVTRDIELSSVVIQSDCCDTAICHKKRQVYLDFRIIEGEFLTDLSCFRRTPTYF